MGTDGTHPVPGLPRAPVAGGEQNIPSCGFEGHAHGLVTVYAIGIFRKIAIIVFQVIYAPLGKLPGIGEFVVIAGGVSGAGQNTGTGIHTEFEPFAVDIVGYGLHPVGEFFRIRD